MNRKTWDEDRVQMATAERIEQIKEMQVPIIESVHSTEDSVKVPKSTISKCISRIDALDTELDQLYWEARSQREVINTPQAIGNERCFVQINVRFRYNQCSLNYKCDLRAYASFDDRVRKLRLGIKKIVFCEVAEITAILRLNCDADNALDASLPALLMGFVKFFSAQFGYLTMLWQFKIISELFRTYEMLERSESFLDVVCLREQ
ncbi:Hypothetical protein PHPALM_12259 [Phytophthora palmivora]|uniref:Uncharacterized protein n=1 Tax=Phytophthora palmivora TaxID=4796 RepID=A0A2P4Y0E1_9STRA|nr:Hypothetical protein PHPALM_12259 [Phytophthora palmivora]